MYNLSENVRAQTIPSVRLKIVMLNKQTQLEIAQTPHLLFYMMITTASEKNFSEAFFRVRLENSKTKLHLKKRYPAPPNKKLS